MDSKDLLIGIIGITFTLLFFITIIVLVIFAARRQKILRELNESQYQTKLSEVSFSALRAQMNPHFIFNCLNSIKLYTEQNDGATASLYLTKFSKLIRNMLDNARSEQTILSTEIETIKLYLEMEAMRFKEKMTYEIIVDKALDTDFIEVPPLLIQPYVENAIWHGIMHKQNSGKVSVRINGIGENGVEIIIEDDGIGREKAALIGNKNFKHKSHGTQITSERIALFNARHNTNASVKITDLYDNGQQPRGTLVKIDLHLL